MDIVTLALAKNYTSKKMSELAALGPFIYKGSVASYADLPTSANKGEVYTTTDTGDEYVWDSEKWILFGGNKYSAGKRISIDSDNVINSTITNLTSVEMGDLFDDKFGVELKEIYEASIAPYDELLFLDASAINLIDGMWRLDTSAGEDRYYPSDANNLKVIMGGINIPKTEMFLSKRSGDEIKALTGFDSVYILYSFYDPLYQLVISRGNTMVGLETTISMPSNVMTNSSSLKNIPYERTWILGGNE